MPEAGVAEQGSASRTREGFLAFRRGFEDAVAAAGSLVERNVLIGGYLVRMQFAGPGLVSGIVAPFAHLLTPGGGDPDLTIGVWDSGSTGTPLPRSVGSMWTHLESAMPGSNAIDGVFTAYLRPDPGLSMLDLGASQAFYWLPDAAAIPYEDRSAPFRSILSWWMGHHGRQFVHGAVVGTRDGGVLIAGRGGSGKSTMALSAVLKGMLYVGDDYCLISFEETPQARSIYSSAKLHGRNLARLPELRELVTNADQLESEKGVLLLHERFAGQIVDRLPLRAIVVPALTGLEVLPEFQPCPRASALAALGPSTLLQLPGSRPEALRAMAELARSVPAFTLTLSTNLAANAEKLRALVSELAGTAEHGGSA